MRVLIAEDDPVLRRLLGSLLARWGYDVTAVADGQAAQDLLLSEKPPDLAILDWEMPGVDGSEICRRVRRENHEPYIYIFLLTARNQKADLVAGLESGADDYLTKPFDRAELQMRLRTAKRLLDLQLELIEARERLRDKATHDFLTGLWNRAAILEILDRELSRAAREKAPVTILLADLDHFKHVNDVHGHNGGDEVLREVARRLQQSVRIYDSVGRYGGEEFLVVGPGCSAASAGIFADRLRSNIADDAFLLPGDLRLPVTLSMGVLTVIPDGPDTDTAILIQVVDEALYRAKANGRNRVELAEL